ncbi:SAM-dependent methyltransferase [Pseudomonas aeruginosa VRFPA09]|nr:SAM-dependent methyltransferase [Pseudomonas aeruginosa VRFPA09]
MFGGKAVTPLVIRTMVGAGLRAAAQHSQMLTSLWTHIPGLKVVCPSSPYDAKGLLVQAIRDNDPVIFCEHKLLYSMQGEVPEELYSVPFGEANFLRDGDDVTLVTYGRMVHLALDAAASLARQGISCEVLDLRSTSPLDEDSILDLSHYYDLMCADIDYQAQSHCVRRLHQLFGNQGRRHLDLACGTGPHVRHFLDFGYRSAGLDINQPMLDLARQRCPEAHFSRQDMAGFQVDEPLDLITCFLYSIHYNAGLERLRACLASVHGALADGGVFCFNTVDKGQIDNRSFVRHSVEHRGSRFTFGSGWYYSGEGERQALRLGIEKTTDGTTQTWEDEHPMVALSFAELQHLLQTHFEVQVFEHDYERITPWAGSSGNALFVCVKR